MNCTITLSSVLDLDGMLIIIACLRYCLSVCHTNENREKKYTRMITSNYASVLSHILYLTCTEEQVHNYLVLHRNV